MIIAEFVINQSRLELNNSHLILIIYRLSHSFSLFMMDLIQIIMFLSKNVVTVFHSRYYQSNRYSIVNYNSMS